MRLCFKAGAVGSKLWAAEVKVSFSVRVVSRVSGGTCSGHKNTAHGGSASRVGLDYAFAGLGTRSSVATERMWETSTE